MPKNPPTRRQMVTDVALEALNFLVEAPNYAAFRREMTEILETWATHPTGYAGDLSHLNELINIGLQSRELFESLLQLVEERRRLVPESRRTDYQRELMRERRARLYKSVELAELVAGMPMTTSQKSLHKKDVSARWARERDAFLVSRGPLGWSDRNAAAQEFWAGVDARLDASLKAERTRRR